MAEDGTTDLPFRAEYAKSGRASCKACSNPIAKDSLRLAVMIQSHHFDGKVPNWFHDNCFWKRAKCRTETDIYGFNSLRWEDQEQIKKCLSGLTPDIMNQSGKIVSKALEDQAYKDFEVEYAKSNRSKCRGCGEKIEKDNVRLAKKDYESERSRMYGPQSLWHHLVCFEGNRTELEFTEDMDPKKIPGFKDLSPEDKVEVLSKLGKGNKKKRKAENAESTYTAIKQAKKDDPLELELKDQTNFIWKIRDNLQKNLTTNSLKHLLIYNSQQLPTGEGPLLDALSDAMAFGALQLCPECSGQLRFSGNVEGYRCTGDLTEWTKCQYTTTMPKRKPFIMSDEFHDVPFLKSYKYVKRERIYPKIPSPTTSSSSLQKKSETATESVKIEESLPLTGLKISLMGKLNKKKSELISMIEKLGGKLVQGATSTVDFCISNKLNSDKKSDRTDHYKLEKVAIVSEELLGELVDAVSKNIDSKDDLIDSINKHTISYWPNNASERVVSSRSKEEIKSSYYLTKKAEKNEKMFTKEMPATMKMTVKGGAAVDPASELENEAHVLQGKESGELYNGVLGMVDVARGTNSYYKLQVLESDKNEKYWVFRSWGRVGTTIGGTKLEKYNIKQEAVRSFIEVYQDKTGNLWENRKSFQKVPNKFYPLDIDYGADDDSMTVDLKIAGSNSKLEKGVQDLIRLIFDIETMKRAMLEFEIDLKKMPLGKLSRKHIQSAYTVLTELQNLVDTNSQSTSQFLDASNRFYTLVPHDFGMKKPTLLNSMDIIKSKVDMLDNLLDIEIAYNMLKTDKTDDTTIDPIDLHYERLKTTLKVLDECSEEFKRIEQYVANTHAQTHRSYKLIIDEVFVVQRQGENKIYEPFKELNNRMLLWHGSRLTNFVGILSQGLRIAPPEAPTTGYMFGKGVYFADMVSKSANYCSTSKDNTTGLLLLSEVALGNMYELTGAQFINELPKGKYSVKGLGKTVPDPTGNYLTSDGVTVPMGVGVSSEVKKSSLQYNEYIVYDTAQINIKYLIKMTFMY